MMFYMKFRAISSETKNKQFSITCSLVCDIPPAHDFSKMRLYTFWICLSSHSRQKLIWRRLEEMISNYKWLTGSVESNPVCGKNTAAGRPLKLGLSSNPADENSSLQPRALHSLLETLSCLTKQWTERSEAALKETCGLARFDVSKGSPETSWAEWH